MVGMSSDQAEAHGRSADSSLDESNEAEGYDNEFIQAEHGYDCPICTMCLRDPYQTDCGHRFCKNCITRWLRLNDRDREVKCPSCNDMLTNDRIYPDNFAKRQIYTLEAKCVNCKQGCEVQSSLKSVIRHQHTCVYRSVTCPNDCGDSVMAKDYDDHISKSCSKLMVECRLCHHQVARSDITNHQNKCSTANSACPYCGEPVDQSEGDSREETRHVCTSHNIMDCRFIKFGCTHKCPAVDMKQHMEQCQQEHLLCLAMSVERLAEDTRPALEDLKDIESGMSSLMPGAASGVSQSVVKPDKLAGSLYDEDDMKKPLMKQSHSFNDGSNKMLGEDGAYTTSTFHSGEYLIGTEAESTMQLRNQISNQQQHILELRSKVNFLENSLQEVKSELRDTRNENKTRNCQGTFVWRLKNYTKLKSDSKKGAPNCVIHSPGFFTSFNGYQFCIRLNLNGVENAQGTHLSLFIHLMQSENDDILAWPFTGKITLTICDQQLQASKRNNITETLVAKPGLAAFQRPTTYRNHKGFGYMEFAPISYLESEDRRFVKNDTLLIKAEVRPNPM